MSQITHNSDILVRTHADGVLGHVKLENGVGIGITPVELVVADITLTEAHRGKLILADASGGPVTVTLPDMPTDGTELAIARGGDTGTDAVTVAAAPGSGLLGGTSTDLVGGSSTLRLTYSAAYNFWLPTADHVRLDPNSGNLLSHAMAGQLRASLNVGTGMSGDGTVGNPLTVTALAITSVQVVATIAARDALTGLGSGDVVKVADSDGAGHPQTYIYDGAAFIDIQETSDVMSVAGKTGVVTLAINDLTDVDTITTPPAVGETIIWDGTNFVPGAAGKRYSASVTTTPGTPVTVTHNLASNVVAQFFNGGVQEFVSLTIVDSNSFTVDSNVAATYAVNVIG